jgi:hypothetical protein
MRIRIKYPILLIFIIGLVGCNSTDIQSVTKNESLAQNLEHEPPATPSPNNNQPIKPQQEENNNSPQPQKQNDKNRY